MASDDTAQAATAAAQPEPTPVCPYDIDVPTIPIPVAFFGILGSDMSDSAPAAGDDPAARMVNIPEVGVFELRDQHFFRILGRYR